MKAAAKSCSCTQCLRAKRSRAGHAIMRREERAFRHAQKQALRQWREDRVVPAPHGSRIG